MKSHAIIGISTSDKYMYNNVLSLKIYDIFFVFIQYYSNSTYK